MAVVGIVCEYNPFHLGHEKQFRMIRKTLGEDTLIICLMSGNYVQRGMPALFNKFTRSRVACVCGANLVLELPITACLSSAEGFAFRSVEIFNQLGIVTHLCFGSEDGDVKTIQRWAKLTTHEDFDKVVKEELSVGVSYATARARTMTRLGGKVGSVHKPNDILGVEYCKALLRLGSDIEPLCIKRMGSYHDQVPDGENPSATAIRKALEENEPWQDYMPQEGAEIFAHAPTYIMKAGERAMLARVRSLTTQEFENLPYGSEGLWSKVMKNCQRETTIEGILHQSKSKRYARTRLQRMLLCAYLGIGKEDLQKPAPYVRILAFDDEGRKALRRIRTIGTLRLISAGERVYNEAFAQLEKRCSDLYTLFSTDDQEAVCTLEEKSRVFYGKV